MTPQQLTEARKRLQLTAAGLGRALELDGRDPGRYVRAWETDAHPIPGPVRVAVRLMLEAQARQSLSEAVEAAQAILTPTPEPIIFTDPAGPDLRPLHQRTRRRG